MSHSFDEAYTTISPACPKCFLAAIVKTTVEDWNLMTVECPGCGHKWLSPRVARVMWPQDDEFRRMMPKNT